MRAQPLMLGTIVMPWGTIKRIEHRDGERWYLLSLDRSHMAIMPAEIVEREYETRDMYPAAL